MFLLIAACDEAASEQTCSEGPWFSSLPVPLSAIESVKPLGEIHPPGDILPNGQTGFTLKAAEVSVVAPGPIRVHTVERTTWLVSPFRQGKSDYSIQFTIAGCEPIMGVYGHLVTLAPELDALLIDPVCEEYTNLDEKVVACQQRVKHDLGAGDAVGTAGGPTAGGLDFDLFDRRHEASFIAQHRYGHAAQAICMQPLFEEPLATQLLELVSHRGVKRTAEPRCGTQEVDIEGTAQGMWLEEGDDVPYRADTSERFLVLAPHAILPKELQVLGAGAPALLSEHLHVFPRRREGRVNRDFATLNEAGVIHCYEPTSHPLVQEHPTYGQHSFLIALRQDQGLTIERIEHAKDASPCGTDPSTWSFGSGALRYMR